MSPLKAYLLKSDHRVVALVGAVAAFGTYSCMYAFRKPFTAATYADMEWLGIDYKIWLIFAQTIGYTLSKFYGIRFIAERGDKGRARQILWLIALSWLALLLFPLVPKPANMILLLVNGFPLGMVWGLVFSYLEGRRATELMGAFLGVSFIFSSGLVKTVGAHLMVDYSVSAWWMPFFTGLVFVVPLLAFVWLLDQIPPPNPEDVRLRNKRESMARPERRSFFWQYASGILLLVVAYVFLTLLRDVRDNFVANIWVEQGYGEQPGIFTQTEVPVALGVLLIIGLLVLIKNNLRAFMLNHWLIGIGFAIICLSTYAFSAQRLEALPWMMLVGFGLYLAYVPFNCVIFDRFMSTFKHKGNAGFLMYVADSFGYLGSMGFLFYKELAGFGEMSWTLFFQQSLLVISVFGLAVTTAAAIYFKRKYHGQVLQSAQLALN
ncbi:MAG: DUF5690 family protein [Bacteroidota bacterium]|nr:DUF5690 family protein [Bacteroidota bacterium]